MKTLNFSVDSALLRELGERLVAKPHIALSELIKNSYDADATRVVVTFGQDRITVSDNGSGMNFAEFKNFWMRVGSPHRQKERVSRKLKRPLTGSKGVGRLSVQFLASKIALRTVSQSSLRSQLRATVNWAEAVEAGELTNAKAVYATGNPTHSFPGKKSHGTSITLSGLRHTWASADIVDVAKEIWWLQPPFRANPALKKDKKRAFRVRVESPDEDAVAAFESQMRASLDLWHAKLVGKLVGRSEVQLSLQFADGNPLTTTYPAPESTLRSVDFEIRVFDLRHKQRYGIRVDDARQYFNLYGGVHVYDGGFHLPFYGPDTDWLQIEIDHSHRLSRSKLLPDELQVAEGMTYLPTQSRLFGVVNVDTSLERNKAGAMNPSPNDYLQIQITRDRLVDNRALQGLRNIVRWALDFYAMQQAKRALEEIEARRPVEPVREKFARVDHVLERYQAAMPDAVYANLRDHIREAIVASETETELVARQVGLLGALATAGMSTLAYDHEVTKQLQALEEVAHELKHIGLDNISTRHQLAILSDRLVDWVQRARATRGLFTHLLDEENRDTRLRFTAQQLLRDLVGQVEPLARGVDITITDIDATLKLPEATYAEWSAVFQNVIMNALNAMVDSRRKHISISSRIRGRTCSILVQDTGVGVDLPTSNELFQPFVRRLAISQDRKQLGLGGTGLGLAIVRMVAERSNCLVSFVAPDAGFSTAFRLSWSEQP